MEHCEAGRELDYRVASDVLGMKTISPTDAKHYSTDLDDMLDLMETLKSNAFEVGVFQLHQSGSPVTVTITDTKTGKSFIGTGETNRVAICCGALLAVAERGGLYR